MITKIILFAILGRWFGSDVFAFPGKKQLTCILSGALLYPASILAGAVAGLLWFGQALRDSVFDLLHWPIRQSGGAVIRMTARACSFLPLTLFLYYSAFGISITPYLAVVFIPVFSRAPIQLLCRFLPLPVEAPKKGKPLARFIAGRAEVYELLYCAAIGASVFVLAGKVQGDGFLGNIF